MPSSAQMVGTYKSPIQFISGFTGSTLATGVTSVTFSGHQVGDFLLAMGGNQQSADPTFTAGWTKICSYNAPTANPRVGIIVYKIATSTANETVTFTGTGTSSFAYSAGYTFRYVRGVGNFNVVTGTTGTAATTVASPSLTLSDTTNGTSALILASYIGTMTGAPNSMTVTNGMAYGLLRSSWAGGNFTTSGLVGLNCGIVELLN